MSARSLRPEPDWAASRGDAWVHRVLVIDDNVSVHDDFRRVLAPPPTENAALLDLEAQLFGSAEDKPVDPPARYEVDTALQGQQGLRLVIESLADERPYAMAFIDMRMPPGWNGVETTEQIWRVYPAINVVICTAYSDFRWDEVVERLGRSEGLHLLRKPFAAEQVRKLAQVLTTKVDRARRRATGSFR